MSLLGLVADHFVLPDAAEADFTCVAGVRPHLIAMAARQRSVLVVTATEHEAEQMREALTTFESEQFEVTYFPAWETLPHERLSPRSDTVGARLALLRRLHQGDHPAVIVTPIRALLQPMVKGLGAI